ncbi:MAG: DMT family transporter [Candidatus Heimdallarchaeota archaeon]
MAIPVLGEILAVISVLCFVTSNAIFHRIDKHVSPTQINSFRTIIGSVTYFLVALILWKLHLFKHIPGITWFWLILSFIAGQVFGDTAYFKTQEMLGTTNALAISMTFPIFTTVLYIVILQESIPYYFYISLFLIIAGVIIITLGKNHQEKAIIRKISESGELKDQDDSKSNETHELQLLQMNQDSNESSRKSKKKLLLGVGLGLVAGIAWAFGAVLTDKAFTELKVIFESIPIANSDTMSNIIGNLIRFPVAAGILSALTFADRKKRVKKWSKQIWLLLLLGAIIGTSIGAFLYTEAIVLSSAAVMAMIASASPLFSIPITWLINKEKSNWISVIGIIVTISGVVNIFIWELLCTPDMIMC